MFAIGAESQVLENIVKQNREETNLNTTEEKNKLKDVKKEKLHSSLINRTYIAKKIKCKLQQTFKITLENCFISLQEAQNKIEIGIKKKKSPQA